MNSYILHIKQCVFLRKLVAYAVLQTDYCRYPFENSPTHPTTI